LDERKQKQINVGIQRVRRLKYFNLLIKMGYELSLLFFAINCNRKRK